MGKCLVTKLKESVISNENLPLFGKFRIYHYQSESYSLNNEIVIRPQENGEVTVTGGSFVDVDGNNLGTTLQVSAGKLVGIRTTNADCIITIPSYNISNITIPADYYLRVDSLNNLISEAEGNLFVNIVSRNMFESENKVSVSKKTYFTDFIVEGTGYSGDISNVFATVISLKHGGFSGAIHPYAVSGRNNVIGIDGGTPLLSVDFEEFKDATLSTFRVRNVSGGGDIGVLNFTVGCSYIDLPRGAVGTVESLVKKLWDKNKRSGNILLSCYNGAAPSLNGNAMNAIASDWSIVFSASNVTIKPYGQNTIYATYNGSTWTY